MDSKHLEDVLTLIEEGNLSRAAKRRNITQPAFSRRIRAFETWLGTTVLDRKTNRVDISAALRSAEPELRALLAEFRELRTKIVHHEPKATMLRIAAQHAPVSSRFPEMAEKARVHFPKLRFRLHAANLNDCISRFLRKEVSLLLCYESRTAEPMEFGANVLRGDWGQDLLVPVVGGALRHTVKNTGRVPDNTPSIVYPDNSYFGQVLIKGERVFGTSGFSAYPVCETAFSTGMREMALRGMGVAWVPLSMVQSELQRGDLVSLAESYGTETLCVAIYADGSNAMAADLLAFWQS